MNLDFGASPGLQVFLKLNCREVDSSLPIVMNTTLFWETEERLRLEALAKLEPMLEATLPPTEAMSAAEELTESPLTCAGSEERVESI